MAQDLSRDGTEPEVDRPEREAEQRRDDHERTGGERPPCRHAAERPLRAAGEARTKAAGARHYPCDTPSSEPAISSTNSTVRGPHREAMLSSASTMSPFSTASI